MVLISVLSYEVAALKILLLTTEALLLWHKTVVPHILS